MAMPTPSELLKNHILKCCERYRLALPTSKDRVLRLAQYAKKLDISVDGYIDAAVVCSQLDMDDIPCWQFICSHWAYEAIKYKEHQRLKVLTKEDRKHIRRSMHNADIRQIQQLGEDIDHLVGNMKDALNQKYSAMATFDNALKTIADNVHTVQGYAKCIHDSSEVTSWLLNYRQQVHPMLVFTHPRLLQTFQQASMTFIPGTSYPQELLRAIRGLAILRTRKDKIVLKELELLRSIFLTVYGDKK